jgi:hypothetical protein
MTIIKLFLELAKPDENGRSKKIYATEFVGKYAKLRSRNGYKWPENIPYLFERGGRGDSWFIQLVGIKTKDNQRPIRDDIRKDIENEKCSHTSFGGNSSNKIIVDHRNGRYDDERVLNTETQTKDDFQPLCNQANLQKRTHCLNCVKTGLRFDAKTLGYPKSVCEGSLKYEGTCVGCYWHDPIRFRGSLS